eukprot:scaffold130872_cov32-Tisochrysis_lutea.AAC.1
MLGQVWASDGIGRVKLPQTVDILIGHVSYVVETDELTVFGLRPAALTKVKVAQPAGRRGVAASACSRTSGCIAAANSGSIAARRLGMLVGSLIGAGATGGAELVEGREKMSEFSCCP